jgi:hypothetical protein
MPAPVASQNRATIPARGTTPHPEDKECTPMPRPWEKYDRQVIVRVFTGIAADDQVIIDGAINLQKRAHGTHKPPGLQKANEVLTTVIVDYPAGADLEEKTTKLEQAFGKLTKKSRLYILGHGDWRAQTVGGVTALYCAATLAAAKLPNVKIISLVSCNAGRDQSTASDVRIAESANSFASKFHREIKSFAGVTADLYARVYKVGVLSQGQGTGQKITGRGSRQKDQVKYFPKHKDNSKLRFFWDGDVQKREWVFYFEQTDFDALEDDD